MYLYAVTVQFVYACGHWKFFNPFSTFFHDLDMA